MSDKLKTPIDCRKINDMCHAPVIISAETATAAYQALMREPIKGMADMRSFEVAFREELRIAHETVYPDYKFNHKAGKLEKDK